VPVTLTLALNLTENQRSVYLDYGCLFVCRCTVNCRLYASIFMLSFGAAAWRPEFSKHSTYICSVLPLAALVARQCCHRCSMPTSSSLQTTDISVQNSPCVVCWIS